MAFDTETPSTFTRTVDETNSVGGEIIKCQSRSSKKMSYQGYTRHYLVVSRLHRYTNVFCVSAKDSSVRNQPYKARTLAQRIHRVHASDSRFADAARGTIEVS